MLKVADATVLVMHEVRHDRSQRERVVRECAAFVRKSPAARRAAYSGPNEDRHLLLDGHDSIEAWGQTSDDLLRLRERLSGSLDREIRSSVLLRELTVKPRALPAPAAPGLQVRYIEVPPRSLTGYREWRARTIFPYVRDAATVDGFSAYYSLVSGNPGVYFFSEYSCDRETYLATFDTPAYRGIVSEAGARYIADGVSGLRTEDWSLVNPAEQW
jgi:hypothetical protein